MGATEPFERGLLLGDEGMTGSSCERGMGGTLMRCGIDAPPDAPTS